LRIERVEVGFLRPVDDNPAATALTTLEADRNAERVLEAATQRDIVGAASSWVAAGARRGAADARREPFLDGPLGSHGTFSPSAMARAATAS